VTTRSGNAGGGGPGATVVGTLASSAAATGAVGLLVAGLIVAFGSSGTDVAAQERPADPGLTAVSGPPPAAAPAPEATAEPTAEPTGGDDGPAAPTAGASDDERPAAAAAHPAPSVEVVVLNETKRRNLAAVFRDVLADAGWQVGATGNFRGNVPATTVYYPPGLKAEAEALEEAFGQVNRIRPAFPGIPTDKLTVILCKDYPAA
jgi:hypothetical protein